MSNDITTLNGALAELGETIVKNLNNKGVNASANDGLTTLANKINNFESYYWKDFRRLVNITPDNRNTGGVISANGKTLTGTSSMGAFYNNVFHAYTDYEVSFKIANVNPSSGNGLRIVIQSMDQTDNQVSTISEKYMFGIELNSNTKTLDYASSGSVSKTSANFNNGSIIQFRVVDGTLTALCDDTIIFTQTNSWFYDNMRILIHGWGGTTGANISITDFKVKNINLENILKYDTAIMDKTSQYDTSALGSATFTYDSSVSAYQLKKLVNNGFSTIFLSDVIVDNVMVSCDFLLNNSNLNNQPRLCIFNENYDGIGARIGLNNSSYYCKLSEVTPYADGTVLESDDYQFSTNTWYTLVLILEDGDLIYKVYEDGTLLRTLTTSTSLFTGENMIGIQMSYSNGAIMHFKNLKVKEI